jgi:hypothetical protein
VVRKHLGPIDALGENVEAHISANLIGVRMPRARLDLKSARYRLPDVGRALGNVLQRENQSGKGQFVLELPDRDVVARRFVSLGVASAEEFGGSVVEVGAKTETVAAELARFINFVDAVPQVLFGDLGEALVMELVPRCRPEFGEGLGAQLLAGMTGGPLTTMPLCRVHSDSFDPRNVN